MTHGKFVGFNILIHNLQLRGGRGLILINRSAQANVNVFMQDPSKPCVKSHHSLVLRAASASEKYMWLARLKNASEGTGGSKTPIKSFTSEQLRSDSVTSSIPPTPTPSGRRGGVGAHLGHVY